MKNTHAQDKAIKTINKNVAVNAGAGTGKTKVLTERYIYLLENGDLEKGKEIESIVAITFTRKATQEMKERIREEIKSKFPEDEKWRRFYNDMEKANISTIHGFCGNILRENALNLNIDPMFTILDDDEANKLLEETILEVLLKGIEEDENTYNIVKLFGRDDLRKISSELKSIYYKIRTVGISFEEVRDMTLSTIDNIKVSLEDIDYIKNTFIYLMENSRKGSKVYKLQNEDIWRKFYNGEYGEEELIPILEYLYDNIGTNKNEADTIEELESTIERNFLIKEKEYRWVYETVLDLLLEIDTQYSHKKEELAALDYDDLQILTLELLEDREIVEEYQDKFKYIMVDEFQDTNELQKKIFYKLCSKNKLLDRENLFIVGDPKQSIYGFRGADLDVFYDVMEDIKEVSVEGPIVLEKNFRTVDTILNMVNDLFEKLMGKRYDKLDNFHVSENKIDVEILEKEDLEIPANVEASEYNAYYESRLIASRIQELVETKEFNYGDFALLFRASTLDHIYEDALIDYGIPYYNIGGGGFFETQEVVDIMNGLKCISNRYDTISTIGFLRSPMVGISDKTLYWLLRYKENTLFDTMKMEIPYIEEVEREKLLKASRLLEEMIVKKNLYGVHYIVEELVHRTYYEEVLLLQLGGKQSLANVYKFVEIARKFDREYRGSVEDFIDYIEEIKNTDEPQAKIQAENDDVVKLMTIHKAKGLQFPVVVIPQMARGFNYQMSNILFNKEKGIGIKYEDKSPLYESIRSEIKEKEMEENQRVLYVAMTRAEKRLLIGNQGKDKGFKNLVKDLIDKDDVIKIRNISAESVKQKSIELIDEKQKNIKSFNRDKYPLVLDIPKYNEKIFNSFSVSQYLNFNECKRQFYMTYYKKLPMEMLNLTLAASSIASTSTVERILDPSLRGTIVHKFTEHYSSDMDPKVLLEKVVNSFGIEYDENIEKELHLYVENYLEYYSEDYDKIYTEQDFYLEIENTYVYGIIDRINIKNNQAEIIDFKTNKVDNKNDLIEYYKPQLQLYAYAVQKIMDIDVSRACLLLLETGELEEVDISLEALDKNYEDIRAFIKFVNDNSSIDKYEKAKECGEYCKYKILCDIN